VQSAIPVWAKNALDQIKQFRRHGQCKAEFFDNCAFCQRLMIAQGYLALHTPLDFRRAFESRTEALEGHAFCFSVEELMIEDIKKTLFKHFL
jgi:hypothetical protein